MAKIKKPQSDILANPKPHTKASKAAAEAVLGTAIKAGSTVLSVLSGLLAAILLLYSGYVLYDTFFTMNNAVTDSWDLLEYKPEILEDGPVPLAGGDMLQSINDDYRAWLTVYDSTIDYPVVQGPDDLYYASHDIYGHTALTGAIYLAAGNNRHLKDSYNLIYGHHMDNGAMFGALDAFTDRGYFDSHKEGLLIGTSGIYDVEFFAVARADAYEGAIYNVGSSNSAEAVIAYLASGGNSGSVPGIDGESPSIATQVLIFDEEVAKDAEKVVALSTCADATTNGRLLVFGKMIKRNVLMLDAVGYEGVYDGQIHMPIVDVSIEEGTTITYSISTDGGTTWTDWSEDMPSILNVGEIQVKVRAEHEFAGEVEASCTLKIHPRPVTILVDDAFKIYLDPDPAWQASYDPANSPVGSDEIAYTLSREPGENVGTYPINAFPEGELTEGGAYLQGNYIVTVRPGTLTITPAGTLAVTATGYTGVYDGERHYAESSVNITEGTTVEYSTDGGKTWTTEVPYIIDPGEIPVMVRATNPNYGIAYATTMLIVTPVPAPEDEVNVSVIKIWDDDNNSEGLRPSVVYMVLTGDEQAHIAQLGAANNWSATFVLPKYDDAGDEITYTWTEPDVAGYTAASATSRSGDTIVTTFTNTVEEVEPVPSEYTLTIRYRYPDGTPAAQTFTITLAEGETFDVTSPVIPGYIASIIRVTGTMPGRDVEYVVTYVPVPAQTDILIDDYNTPLGLDNVYINIGDCYE